MKSEMTLDEALRVFLKEHGKIAWNYNPFEGHHEIVVSLHECHGRCWTDAGLDRTEVFRIAVQLAKDAMDGGVLITPAVR